MAWHNPTLLAAIIGPVVAFLLGRLGRELTQRASQRAAEMAKADQERESFRSMVVARFDKTDSELADIRTKLAGVTAVIQWVEPRLRHDPPIDS